MTRYQPNTKPVLYYRIFLASLLFAAAAIIGMTASLFEFVQVAIADLLLVFIATYRPLWVKDSYRPLRKWWNYAIWAGVNATLLVWPILSIFTEVYQ